MRQSNIACFLETSSSFFWRSFQELKGERTKEDPRERSQRKEKKKQQQRINHFFKCSRLSLVFLFVILKSKNNRNEKTKETFKEGSKKHELMFGSNYNLLFSSQFYCFALKRLFTIVISAAFFRFAVQQYRRFWGDYGGEGGVVEKQRKPTNMSFISLHSKKSLKMHRRQIKPFFSLPFEAPCNDS